MPLQATMRNSNETTMKKMKRLLFVILFTHYAAISFSQTIDSLRAFPNPFASSTTIHFHLAQPDTITLLAFDITGKTVRTLLQSAILSGGSYNIRFTGDSLADGIYFIRIEGGSKKARATKVVKSSSTAIPAINKRADQYIIFPNPAKDWITIPVNGNKTITITDLNGSIIKSFTTNQQMVSLADLAAGVYLITILTNQNEILTTQKIQKHE